MPDDVTGPNESKVIGVMRARPEWWMSASFLSFVTRVRERSVRHHLRKFVAGGLVEAKLGPPARGCTEPEVQYRAREVGHARMSVTPAE